MKMNKACDLSSISVLPPHSRKVKPMSQLSLSQGNSLSQFSQSSIEETLTNDTKFDSQDRWSSKRISSLPQVVTARDESQLALSRISSNIVRRWGSSSASDSQWQGTEELENRFRHIDNSLNKMMMVLDSVQSDVIQINRAVKDVSLQTEGVRDKICSLDNSMQKVIKDDEELKAFVDASLKAISNQIADGYHIKLNEVASTVSLLPKQIEEHLIKLEHEVCKSITKNIEILASDMRSPNIVRTEIEQNQSKKRTYYFANQQSFNSSPVIRPEKSQSPQSKCYIATRQTLKSQRQNITLPPGRPSAAPSSKMEAGTQKTLKPKPAGSNHQTVFKQDIPSIPQGKVSSAIIDLDEESDGGLSFLVKKETGKSSHLIDEEAMEDTIRILREARKQKRRRQNCVILD